MDTVQLISFLIDKYDYPDNEYVIKAFNNFIKNKNKSSIMLATLIKIEYENDDYNNCYQSSTYAVCKYKLHKELDYTLSDEEKFFSVTRGGSWSHTIKLIDIFEDIDNY
jgi:hypothetical protein